MVSTVLTYLSTTEYFQQAMPSLFLARLTTLDFFPFQKNLMWNTVTVQYNPLIEEEFDEHFKVTCEYGYDFWKTVTFPFLDVE